jgi:outer membrane receptor protein involved in Fe transport
MICGVAALALGGAAYAEDQPVRGDAATTGEVIVTGTRLPTKDFQAVSPVTTVNSEQLALTGTVATEQLLNELPQVVPGNTVTSNNSGGENYATIDLRGLGPNRTLVVINGERVPGSSTTGVVDLNTIPAGLIDRIEVLTGGASAVYGSDAMAGVVNFILKKNFSGVQINGLYGSSFEGKAPEKNVDVMVGGNFAEGKGNITAYASYYQRDPVFQSEFDWSKTSAGVYYDNNGVIHVVNSAAEYAALRVANGNSNPITALSGGSGTPPWGWITNNPANAFTGLSTNPATAAHFTNVDTDCNPATAPVAAVNSGNLSFNDAGALTPRFTGGACSVPDRSAGSSRYNFAPVNMIIIPAKRFNIATYGHYDITDNITANFGLTYVDSRTGEQLASTPATGLTVVLTPATSSYIQANHPDLWAALQSRPQPLANFVEDWRSVQLGPRIASFDNNSLTMTTTVDGRINDHWKWSLTAGYGQSRFTETLQNNLGKTAVEQALAGCQVPISSGQPGAGAPLGIEGIPGCVQADIWGAGKLSPAAIAFLRTDTHSLTNTSQGRFEGIVTGDLFQLPAGAVTVALGAEWRRDRAAFNVDNAQAKGDIYGFNAVQSESGAIIAKELYGEIGVPLLKDMPFVNYLGLEGGYRLSDYSTIGTTHTYKFGGTWNPVSWLKVRAIYNRAVRAPNVFELFQNGDQGFPGYKDPCQGATGANATFCTTWRGPAYDPASFVANNTQVQAFSFGNPHLLPETAKTWTAGVVIQPSRFWFGTPKVSVDYYNIKIANAIEAQTAQFFLNGCLSSASLASADCQRIAITPETGQVFSVNTGTGNIGALKTSGIDAQLDWSMPLGDAFKGVPGTIRINEVFNWTSTFNEDGTELADTTEGAIGTAFPRIKSVLAGYYTLGPWMFFARWSYTPGMKQIDWDLSRTPAASYVDMSVRWKATDLLTLTATVDNVADSTPPEIAAGVLGGQGNTDPQVYRVLGRTFTVQASVRF